ncbi:MAG: ribosome maturation factor RimM [Oscillospiraceae bacterium]
MKQFLEVGKPVTTHGVLGELKVYPWCDDANLLCKQKVLFLDGEGKLPLRILSAREHGKMALVKFEGYETIEKARLLIDKTLWVDRDKVALPEGAHFIADIIGLTAINLETGTACGKVVDVTDNGAHDIYHIVLENGKTAMIPAVKEFIKKVDIENGRLEISPIKGLLNDED